mgnify:CR=1 FL=1
MSRLKTDAIRNVNASVDGITLDTSGNVAIPNELQLAEKIVHTGDTNTFIRFTDNQIDFQSNGSSRLYINQYAAYVQTGYPLAFLSSSGATPNIKSGGTNNQDLLFTTGSGNPTRVQIASNGKVGIGTDPSAYPGKFVVSGDALICDRDIHSRVANSIANSDRGFKQDIDGTEKLHLYADNSSHIILENNGGVERLRITSDGKVGIGIANPAKALVIAKDSASAILELRRTNTNTTGSFGAISWTAMDGHSVANMYALGDGDNEGAHLVFRTTSAAASNDPYNAATVERLRINSDGTTKFTQHPTTRTNTVDNYINEGGYIFHYVARTTSGADRYRRMFDMASVGDTTWGSAIRFSTNPDGNATTSERMRITHEGKVGISNNNPSGKLSVSDAGSTADPVIQAHISGSNGSNLGFGLYSDVNSKYTFKVTNNGRVQVNDGIDFSLTSHASGMTSELLNDYEEGTWSPTLTRSGSDASVTYQRQTGKYTKTGNCVMMYFDIEISSESGGNGGWRVMLPFTFVSGSSHGGHGAANFRDSSLFGRLNMANASCYLQDNYIGLAYINSSGNEVSAVSTGSGRVTGMMWGYVS